MSKYLPRASRMEAEFTSPPRHRWVSSAYIEFPFDINSPRVIQIANMTTCAPLEEDDGQTNN